MLFERTLDDDFVELYETCPNPHLVGLVAFLNMVVDRPNCFYYYAERFHSIFY